MEKGFFTLQKVPSMVLGAAILFGLYLTSLYSYLLFHSLVEIFTVVVGFAIFIIAWNARHLLDNGYLIWVGMAYLFVNMINILHTLAYKGMQIFPDDANLPTQLWIGGQYLHSLSLLVAPLFLKRRFKARLVLAGYAIITGLLLISIFGGVFPDCYLEDTGLTPFKKVSEVIISVIYLAAIALLLKNRAHFHKPVLRLLVFSIISAIAAELSFIFYISVYGFSNLLGHFLRIISFYLVYKALVETGLVQPFNLLFRNLKQREEILRQYTYQLQERNEELDAFAHTVAHDLRGPLSCIMGFTEVLMSYSATLSAAEREDSLKSIQQMTVKMNNIIHELLLLAQVRQAEVELAPLNMSLIIQETRQRLAPMLEEANGEIIAPDWWPPALGYPAWVEEVWTNYISNAIKYGNRPPRVELGATPQPDGMVRFWVRDNGPGLSSEQQAKLFTPFTQLTHIRATGYGLGLSIVARIMDKLGGQAGVESEGINGRGSLFYFTLPGVSSENSLNAEEHRASTEGHRELVELSL